MRAFSVKLQAVPGGKPVEPVAMPVVHFSLQHVDGLGAALLAAWQYLRVTKYGFTMTPLDGALICPKRYV